MIRPPSSLPGLFQLDSCSSFEKSLYEPKLTDRKYGPMSEDTCHRICGKNDRQSISSLGAAREESIRVSTYIAKALVHSLAYPSEAVCFSF